MREHMTLAVVIVSATVYCAAAAGSPQREIDELRERAERLDRAGREEEAGRLRREIAEREGEGDRQECRDEEEGREEQLPPEIRELAEKMEHLLREADRAEESDDGQRADRLREEAERAERRIDQFHARREHGRMERELTALRRRAKRIKDEGDAVPGELVANMHRIEIDMASLRLDRAEEELRGMFEKADRLAEKGRDEEAREIHRAADKKAAVLKKKRMEIDRRRMELIKKRIHGLHAAARRAKEEGREDEARDLAAEAEQIDHHLRREMEERTFFAEIDRMRSRFRRMLKEADDLEKNGHVDEAERLRREAADLECEIDRRMAAREREHAEREMRDLRAAAEERQRAGEHEKADQLRREAAEIARDREERRPREHAGAPAGELHREIEHLRRQVERLESEVGELRRELDRRPEHRGREGEPPPPPPRGPEI